MIENKLEVLCIIHHSFFYYLHFVCKQFDQIFTFFPLFGCVDRGKLQLFKFLTFLSLSPTVLFCVSCIIAFMVFIQLHNPQLFKYLGWSFYICCATLLYASVVSVTLGLVEGSGLIEPTIDTNYNGQPVLAT